MTQFLFTSHTFKTYILSKFVKCNKFFFKNTNKNLIYQSVIIRKFDTMHCISKNTTPTLYCNQRGAPSRMVLLTIRNLSIRVDLQFVDTARGEQNNPEFVKLNPLHQVPVLHIESINLNLPESRAIMIYLATIAKSPLYPTDLKKRSLVDARLFFDASTTSPAIKQFTVKKLFDNLKIIKNYFSV